MEMFLKRIGLLNLIVSIIFISLGLILFLNPVNTISFIAYSIEILLILIGIITISSYIIVDSKYNMFSYGFVYGVICILLALFLMINPKSLITILSTIIGIWMIFGSFSKIQFGIKISLLGKNSGIFNIIMAILMFSCGMLVICNPFTAVSIILKVIGLLILIYSTLDLIENISFLRNVNLMSDNIKD